MRKELIVILLFAITVAILFYIQWGRRYSEGYETILNKVQDRANPLAAPVHPLKNPNAEHGISESSGANLRELNLTALNTGLDMRRANQDLTVGKRIVRLSPRIDNENSFLGMVKFCKDIVDESAKASPPANPFNNPTFKKHCGVCMGEGSLITGESFSRLSNNGRGTGILVYEEDKNRVIETQTRNNYKYPRAIPSLDAAQCSGASLYDDSQVPVLAINSKMYYDMLTRLDCINTKIFKDDHTCGRCVTGGTTNTWSYVKNPAGQTVTDFENGLSYDTSAGINPIFLDLYGVGNAKVTIAGNEILGTDNQVIGSVALKINSPTTWDLSKTSLGYAKEGDKFIIELSAVNNGIAYVGGMLRGNAPPDDVESKLQLANVYMKDVISGGRTARGPRIATPTTDNIITFVPSTEPGNTKRLNPVLKMECFVPLTFISSSWDNDHPQIAYYDCMNNPYITSGVSESLLTDDACLRDKSLNQPLSVECFQNLLSEIGCTSAGSWWRNTNILSSDAGSKDTVAIRRYLTQVFPTARINQTINMKCFGIDTGNPCDDYLGKDTPPSAQCLIQLYTNQITENTRLTPTEKEVYRTESFIDYPLNYRSLDKNTDQFCRPNAGLDPSTPSGLSKLQGISQGYNGLYGVDAVKKYLTDMYDRAVNTSLDIHSDGDGGRKNAWMDCFGIPIAKPKEVTETKYEDETPVTSTPVTGTAVTSTPVTGTPVTSTPVTGTAVVTPVNTGKPAGTGQWYGFASSADGSKLLTGNHYVFGSIYTSTDSGLTWTARTEPGTGHWGAFASSADGSKLVAGDTQNGNMYTSTDSGLTWTPRGVPNGGGDPRLNGRSWLGFASSADGSKLLTGNNRYGYIYTSTDSGLTWTPRSVGNIGSSRWFGFASSADGSKLVTGDWNNGYIYTSIDSGVTWTPRSVPRIVTGWWTGFASSADGSKLVTGNYNYGKGGYIYTSIDSGATWTARSVPTIGTGSWVGFASSADGSKLVAGNEGGYIYTSTDSGHTWTPRTGPGTGAWYGIASSADGSKLVTGTLGGYIYTSTDSGVTWRASV